mgnify:CR=1 FL=1
MGSSPNVVYMDKYIAEKIEQEMHKKHWLNNAGYSYKGRLNIPHIKRIMQMFNEYYEVLGRP